MGMDADVVVAGAGPAGSTAARLLAEAGCRVLLLDAAPLGREKPCGGGLTSRARRLLDLCVDDLVRARVDLAEVRYADRVGMRMPLGEHAVWMVRRSEFDRRLAETAQARGAEMHDREAVESVDPEPGGGLLRVRTARGVYRAGVALVATGGDTHLAAPSPTAPALEVEGRAVSSRLGGDAVVFDYALHNGYAWAFPKGEQWNVGVVTTDAHPGARLRRDLDTVLARWGMHFDDDACVHACGRRIPLWHRPCAVHRGRVALLGDAAGLADPFYAEGIAGALACGRLAAHAALAVLGGDADDMSAYSHALDGAMRAHMRHARALSRLVYPRPLAATWALRLLPPARGVALSLAGEPLRL
jgi:geranylgeranyl reductase family protein